MALLIIYDYESRQEIGRREAREDERYALYQMVIDPKCSPFTLHGKCYRVRYAAWNPLTEQIVIRGTFESYEAGYVDCE